MKEWILVLTLLPGLRDGGVAIEHIPGFASKADCTTAGVAWESLWARHRVDAMSVCVQRVTR